MQTRAPIPDDIDRLGQIAEQSGLFPADMMPDMIAPAFDGGADVWLVAADDTGPIGFGMARAEELADRVWNILAIAIDPVAHGGGHGKALLAAMEVALTDARLIVIETTQLPEQAAARAMYAGAGYAQATGVPDFYSDGEDKVIFHKRVAA